MFQLRPTGWGRSHQLETGRQVVNWRSKGMDEGSNVEESLEGSREQSEKGTLLKITSGTWPEAIL